MDEEREDLHRRINYELCTSLDMIKLGIVLEKMEQQGILTIQESKTFRIQASALLASMRNANDKAFGKTQGFPIL